MFTLEPNLRAKADGWDHEDGDEVRLDKEVGLSGCGRFWLPPTPLHAIGAGWTLMAPPVKDREEIVMGKKFTVYYWWFTSNDVSLNRRRP
jgi:hypothetical protein